MMKGIARLMCFGSLNAGALWIEYQTALLIGTGYFFFADGSALALLTAALLLAPEGRERPDGFHIRQQDRRASVFRYIPILSTSAGATMRLKLRLAD
jgi:hypothetical protein